MGTHELARAGNGGGVAVVMVAKWWRWLDGEEGWLRGGVGSWGRGCVCAHVRVHRCAACTCVAGQGHTCRT